MATYLDQLPPETRGRLLVDYSWELYVAQRWVDAVGAGVTTGNYTDGPGSWDGYAAAAVCEAGVESLDSGLPADVKIVERASIKGA